jgi:hypothetical protein
MAVIKAISYKNWCTDNISPQCWPRIILRSMNVIRAQGLKLKEIEDPDPEFELNDELIEVLNKSLEELYETKVESDLLSLY